MSSTAAPKCTYILVGPVDRRPRRLPLTASAQRRFPRRAGDRRGDDRSPAGSL